MGKDQGQVRMLECGIRWAVEAKGKKEEAQRKSKAGKSQKTLEQGAEGEMRGVGRTRPAGTAKEMVTAVKGNMEAKEHMRKRER